MIFARNKCLAAQLHRPSYIDLGQVNFGQEHGLLKHKASLEQIENHNQYLYEDQGTVVWSHETVFCFRTLLMKEVVKSA